jgi:beta-glucosidase
MGYTDWEYESMAVQTDSVEVPHVTVSLRNRGDRRGSEVVQLYASAGNNDGRPGRVLAGFDKVEADPGESVKAVIRPPLRVFQRWESESGWVMQPGIWTLTAGRSMTDLRLRAEILAESADRFSVSQPAPS